GGEQGVDARLTGLLVVQQAVGHPGVGRDDEDAPIEGRTFTRPDQDVLQHRLGVADRGAADLLDGVRAHHAALGSTSGPRAAFSGSTAPRVATKGGRGARPPNGSTSRLETAL